MTLALLSGSSFLGPGTFPESFPPATPSTPALPEFAPGPPPSSYQSDIPSSLLTPEKSAPCLPGQVSASCGVEDWLQGCLGPFYQVLVFFPRWHQRVTWTRPTTQGLRGCSPPASEGPQGPSCTIQTLPQRPGSPWAQ